MASQHQLHFILFPLMAPGHMIPMIDIARLLAQHGVMVTILTTPLNANRFKTTITRSVDSGLRIQLLEIRFPCVEAGLPEGCENMDTLPSLGMIENFFVAISMLQQPVEQLLEELKPQPTCIVSDMAFPWTTDVAHKFHIPRLVFHGTCCFSLLCSQNILTYKVLDNVTSDSEYFVVPGLPIPIELTKAQLPSSVNVSSPGLKKISDRIREAEKETYGIIVNSFEELEPEFIKEYQKAKGKKLWSIGPVSLCNKDNLDKAERGNKASVDEQECLKWLDSRESNSVVYASFGSISQFILSQMIELGLGLEASNKPFIWVMRNKLDALEKWIYKEGFEERTRGRGLLIRGWAPQVLILSHPAIGGFLTHCGWNSTIEGVCAGVPMVTWPLFAEQFCNEKLVVQVLQIGVRVGVEVIVKWGEEESGGVLVKKDDVKKCIDMLMDGGEEGEERRKRARDLGEKANKAIQEGGSSNLNITLLIQDIKEQANYGQ
ncbi:UDP-glycosyltransferase 73C6-like [Cornus florida]|uniref:UDP-glycosyltransferase 73C6-like n=1 Tax=Cornus florida TaxID=4283 RepID=UPI00289BD3D0|nr:UDP-glycosyltransferase 73C6-like [Cornus florida]